MAIESLSVTDGLTFLSALSMNVYKACNDNRALTDLLNEISPEGRHRLHEQYKPYNYKVNGLRNRIATVLSASDISYEQLEDLIGGAMRAEPKVFKTIYINWFSILYPFVLVDNNDQLYNKVDEIVEYIQAKLSAQPQLKVKIVDFSGPRNNGSSECWIAFYNSSHSKQTTAKQLFLKIENGVLTYCLYDRPSNRMIGEVTLGLDAVWDLDAIVECFQHYLPEVLADNFVAPGSNVIKLKPGEQVFKVSMGLDYFGEGEFDSLIERGIIVMDGQTLPLATSSISQGQYFSDIMKVDDYVYVCNSNQRVAVLGKIVSEAQPYDYLDWGAKGWVQRKFEPIKFPVKTGAYVGPSKWWTPNFKSTCYPIKQDELNLANEILFQPIFNMTFDTTPENMNGTAITTPVKFANNIILYGPPGTGKTYNTAVYAVSIVENKPVNVVEKEDRKDVVERFGKYKQLGQIEFITFHQNYSYEEFIQGIRPKVESATQLLFEKKEGLFKRFADTAYKNLEDASGNEGAISALFDDVFDVFFKPLIDESGTIKIPMDTPGYSFELTKYNPDQRNIQFVKQNGGTGHALYIPTLKAYYDFPDVDHTQGLKYYYRPVVKKMREMAMELKRETGRVSKKNYVFIIDEINRANISRVFGELITLIEEDKRWGNSEGMKINLPSGDDFTVPNNLYIIGTMNTADKSISMLDIALRRRFDFKALYPIYDKETWWGSLLEQLNEAIYDKKKNPDYFIGHAFFINKAPSEIKNILREKILPLLQEYFQDNGNTAMQILAKAGILCRRGTIAENFQIIID